MIIETKIKIDDFTFFLYKKKVEQKTLDQISAIAEFNVYDNSPKKHKRAYKSKEITTFGGMFYLGILILKDIFDFIALNEAIKGFAGNRYTSSKKYKITDYITANMIDSKGLKMLKLTMNDQELLLDKLECSILSAKFSKIIQKCDLWLG